ncbi:MAG: nicotinate-nucleotide adenylyltransferase [Gammaproteobacteria bacterium]|nr:nicotinate-nucleotide adenylyltransferase [Gammaproteobacteria bacterium]
MIGIFGGTFDPIHRGHTGAVSELCRAFSLQSVHWVLSARPPHKGEIGANIEQRLAMLRIALQSTPEFVVDEREVSRPQKSYTYDTVQEFRKEFSGQTLGLIIGTDSLLQFHKWYRYKELIEQVHLLILRRPGYDATVPLEFADRLVSTAAELTQYQAGKIALYEDSEFDISSSAIRELLAVANRDATTKAQLEELLEPQILAYIEQHQLYENKYMNPTELKEQVVSALEDIKGQDIKVLDIAEISDFADFMVVVSGTSDTHVRALAREASDRLRKQGVNPLNEDGADLGEWVLVDFGDVVLHVMRPEVRDYYDLEKLWDEDVRDMVKAHRETQDD